MTHSVRKARMQRVSLTLSGSGSATAGDQGSEHGTTQDVQHDDLPFGWHCSLRCTYQPL
jgi:hypothetical protein